MELKHRFLVLQVIYPMVNKFLKSEKGSSSLEGAIIFPVIFIFLFSLIMILFFFFNRFNIMASSDYILRKTAYSWYDNKKLYDDIFGFSTEDNISYAKDSFNSIIEPVFTNNLKGDFDFNNLFLYKSVIFNGSFNGFRYFSIKESFPFYRGSVFIRNYSYTKELIEDALAYLDDKSEDGDNNEEDDSKMVYIVDGNTDEREYDRVYHLYDDCIYLKNGYEKKISIGESRDLGFRCCRICLARKRGMD